VREHHHAQHDAEDRFGEVLVRGEESLLTMKDPPLLKKKAAGRPCAAIVSAGGAGLIKRRVPFFSPGPAQRSAGLSRLKGQRALMTPERPRSTAARQAGGLAKKPRECPENPLSRDYDRGSPGDNDGQERGP